VPPLPFFAIMPSVKTLDIPDNLRQFIFEHVDSLALLEVLFLLRDHPEGWFHSEFVAKELRTSASSVTHRLVVLLNIGLLIDDPKNKNHYRYSPKSPELSQLITQLADFYKLKPHRVLELIFSSTKRARQFADAFTITKSSKPEEDDNG